ncbi:pyrroloquinoline quinone precursor peptide PqqA [Actinokineospora auranticolor]|uniref:Coenzyme PQQ synthesis protein A n=1 Tax=Actinokineospora auranticolor TaxID=155976 RepID=A0A2S6GPV1_9PSEU|nr:pyrroloquinoline quinone precursor peptide PqqA [Actinokineospora auranticolor]PPK67200.1 coenzyme PQQ precursor peptide PqqA [Actinokineospora auranticolor]
MEHTEPQPWVAPEITEYETPMEITAYVARQD